MFRLFVLLVLILGCSRESGVLQAPQANSEIKFLKPAEMLEFIELNGEFLKGIKENTLFNPAGLLPGKFGKLFRIIPNKIVVAAAKLKSRNPWDQDILSEVIELSSSLKKDLDKEAIYTPLIFYETAKHPDLYNALGYFFIDRTGIWMPDAVELTGRAQILNKYLEEQYNLITKFYAATGKERAEEYLRNFAKDASLPLVNVNMGAISMHDLGHQISILYPPWLIGSYRIYAQDTIDFIEYLQKRNFFDQFNQAFKSETSLGTHRYDDIYWKDGVINDLYKRVGKDIDSQLGNFQNSLRAERYKFSYTPPEDIPSILELTFKDRILSYFNFSPKSVIAGQRQALKEAVTKEIDKFLKGRRDIQGRQYFDKSLTLNYWKINNSLRNSRKNYEEFNDNKKYATQAEMAQDANKYIDYIAKVISESESAQKDLIEGSVVKPTGNLK